VGERRVRNDHMQKVNGVRLEIRLKKANVRAKLERGRSGKTKEAYFTEKNQGAGKDGAPQRFISAKEEPRRATKGRIHNGGPGNRPQRVSLGVCERKGPARGGSGIGPQDWGKRGEKIRYSVPVFKGAKQTPEKK